MAPLLTESHFNFLDWKIIKLFAKLSEAFGGMKPKELFLELENREGKPIYLLRAVYLYFQRTGASNFSIDKQVDYFFEACFLSLKDFWAGFLSAPTIRLAGMETFTEDQVLAEINRTLELLRDHLNKKFNVILPEKKLMKTVVH